MSRRGGLARGRIHHVATRCHAPFCPPSSTIPVDDGGADQHTATERVDGGVIMRAVHVNHPPPASAVETEEVQ